MFNFWKTCLFSATAAVLTLGGTAHADTIIQGAGGTFPQPLYAKWIEAYSKLHPDIKLNYGAVGSGAGIKQITDRVVQFGASDAPLNAAQEKATPAHLLHLPTVAGPAVMIYNLAVPNLKLNGDAVADIYLGKIKKWSDPKIAALNAGTKLPDAPLLVVHRSDGSGTSYIFTDFLSKVSKEWDDKIGSNTAPDWPLGIGGKGNDGVAAAVKASEGSIGYVEYAYAKKNSIAFATMINRDGKDVQPTIPAIVAAAAALTQFPEDMKVSITNAAGPESYPISGFTYLLVYDDLSYMKDKNLASETVKFILWCETDGQEMAADLGYAKLPKEAQERVVAKLKTIKFENDALLK